MGYHAKYLMVTFAFKQTLSATFNNIITSGYSFGAIIVVNNWNKVKSVKLILLWQAPESTRDVPFNSLSMFPYCALVFASLARSLAGSLVDRCFLTNVP